MRLLKVPQANFAELAYLDAGTIVTREGHTFPHPVRVWDLATDAVPAALTEADAEVARFVFRPGGAEFLRRHGLWAAGGPPDPAKAETVLWRPVAEAIRRLPSRGVGRVCAFAPDGEHLLLSWSGVIDGEVCIHFHLLDPAGGVHALHKGPEMIKAVGAFSPDGRLAAMSCGTRLVGVWDLRERREVAAFEANGGVIDLAFVSEDRLLVAAGRSVGVWEAATGRLVKKSRGFHRRVSALAVSADLRRFAAGDGDGTVRVWDAPTGREVGEYDWGTNVVLAVAFSPDGTTAAAAGYPAVAVWDLD